MEDAPLFVVEPYHVARAGIALAAVLLLVDPSIGWFLIALGCAVLEWQTRTRGSVWSPRIRAFLARYRLAANSVARPDIPDADRSPAGVLPFPRPGTAPRDPVIPIEPLSAGAMLTGAFRATWRNWKVSFGFTLVTVLAAMIVMYLAVAVVAKVTLSAGALGDSLDGLFASLIAVSLVLVLLLFVVGIPADAAINGVCVVAADRAIRGAPVRLPEVVGRMRRQFFPLCRLMLVFYLLATLPSWVIMPIAIFAGGFGASAVAMCLLFVAEFVIGVLFSLAPVVMILEGTGVVAALGRSAELVRRSLARIVGLHLLWAVLASAALLVSYVPFGLLGLVLPSGTVGVFVPVVLVLFVVVAFPVFRTVQTIIYTDLRLREDGYRDELVRDRAGNDARFAPQAAAGSAPAPESAAGAVPAGAPLFAFAPHHACRVAAGLAILPIVLDPPGIPWLIIIAGCLGAEWFTRTRRISWSGEIGETLAVLRLHGPTGRM